MQSMLIKEGNCPFHLLVIVFGVSELYLLITLGQEVDRCDLL